MAHEQIGVYSCWNPLCGKDVPVKKTATGKLSASCPWCDFPHYANAGTQHYKGLLGCTKLHRQPESAPVPEAPPPAPAEAPPPATVRRSMFGPRIGGAK